MSQQPHKAVAACDRMKLKAEIRATRHNLNLP